MNQEELRKEAMSILAEHGTQTTVEQLEDNISDDNAVLKLKWCLEAIEAALSKGAEWESEREKWISVTEKSVSDLEKGFYWVTTKKKKEVFLYILDVSLKNIHERNVWLTRFSKFAIPTPPKTSKQ